MRYWPSILRNLRSIVRLKVPEVRRSLKGLHFELLMTRVTVAVTSLRASVAPIHFTIHLHFVQ
jgi:hypothetical protein